MYLFISERKNAVIVHASNSLKYFEDNIKEWCYPNFDYSVKKYGHDLMISDFSYVLLYKNKLRSNKFEPIMMSDSISMLREAGKKKKQEYGMKDFKYQSYRIVRLTKNCLDYDDKYYEKERKLDMDGKFIEEEKPKRKVNIRSQADGGYMIFDAYTDEWLSTEECWQDVVEWLDDNNATKK